MSATCQSPNARAEVGLQACIHPEHAPFWSPPAQCQHDFVQGHYPVVKEDAAQMCALQMQAGHASTLMDDDEGIMMCVEKYVTKQVRGGWGGWAVGVVAGRARDDELRGLGTGGSDRCPSGHQVRGV